MTDKITKTWLQCQVPTEDWNKLNDRRIALELKWADILLPGVEAYLEKLEAKAAKKGADKPQQAKGEEEAKAPAKSKSRRKAAPASAQPPTDGGDAQTGDTIMPEVPSEAPTG